MQLFRSIFALIIAMLIANPACCCAALKPVDQPAPHSCCGGAKKEKKESVCDCTAKSQKIAEKHGSLPAAPSVVLPLPVVSAPVPVEIPVEPKEATVRLHNTGPPRERLALLQRFLI